VQTIVLPIADRQNEYARQVLGQLQAAGLRAEIDERSDKINFKIREAQLQKIPYMLVVGDREAQAGQVAVRNRKHGDQGAATVDAFVSRLSQLNSSRTLEE
jgi:threonyl-tRNA synthetase